MPSLLGTLHACSVQSLHASYMLAGLVEWPWHQRLPVAPVYTTCSRPAVYAGLTETNALQQWHWPQAACCSQPTIVAGLLHRMVISAHICATSSGLDACRAHTCLARSRDTNRPHVNACLGACSCLCGVTPAGQHMPSTAGVMVGSIINKKPTTLQRFIHKRMWVTHEEERYKERSEEV
jgi:hypothetical protein